MAYFEIDVLASGLDRAILVGTDTDLQLAGPSSRELLIWNQSSVPVNVTLVTAHGDVQFEDNLGDLTQYEDLYQANEYRSFEVDDNVPGFDGSFYYLRGLQPNATHALRIENVGNTTRDWLDEDSCVMSTDGHGSNVHNGDRVYVIPFHLN